MMWIGDESLRSQVRLAAEQLRAAAHGKPLKQGVLAARQAHELLAAMADAPAPIWHLLEGTTLEEEGQPAMRWVHSLHASAASAALAQERLRSRWAGVLASHGRESGHGLTTLERRAALAAMQPADSGFRLGPLGCDWIVRELPVAQQGVMPG